ncbi:hypothetical protein DDB_G0287789 [Dictyostelium discoideum AX4]|uniref:Uncharacterized protein n=1 Tax=Dictyostelium discoideum TaxID=44689 RepID=Q54JU7_DICDI|nr:hypothetical protein DDB_G0287789 [Dictyostelium discoideum AX4]EAL63541.1 hypothetical protein DDB_G0287789 [Dictyostelium discoideum AX4]|eukprot:XP_637055.1 hypothetical protein DDB_G0287789 [Dictyostelium discoideum AX4]
MISIAYKRPLHCDILIPKGIYSQNNVIWDISPGFDNLFFSIVLFFYNVIQNQNGYIENFNVDLLNVGSFIRPLFNPNTYIIISNNNSDDDEFY